MGTILEEHILFFSGANNFYFKGKKETRNDHDFLLLKDTVMLFKDFYGCTIKVI